MASTIRPIDPLTRFAIIFACSIGLWIAPITLRFPRIVVLVSLIGSMGGFATCYRTASQIKEGNQVSSRRKIQQEELLNFQFALEEMAQKEELIRQYQTVESMPVATPQQLPPSKPAATSLEIKQQKLLQMPDCLHPILECCVQNGGSTTVRQAQRFKGIAGVYSADEIKQFFQELHTLELGEMATDSKRKDSVTFTMDSELYEWAKS